MLGCSDPASSTNPEVSNVVSEGLTLTSGQSLRWSAGQVQTLSASSPLVISGSDIDINGNGATLRLDATFANYRYAPLAVHGDVHSGATNRILSAFGIYVAPGSRRVKIRNLRIERTPVPGSVVRSIAIVKASDVTLENVEITGETLGPVVEIVDSDRVNIIGCNIHDIVGRDDSHKLDLTGAGKPNVTGILVDDVDLLSAARRKNAAYHSTQVSILGSTIANLSMRASVFDAILAQLGIVETMPQTDGINLQRGLYHRVNGNAIVNVDEGVDSFSYQGITENNVIKLSPYVASSAALKFVHGASHNVATANTIIERDISGILDSSAVTSLTGSQGPYGNLIWNNRSTGQGRHLHRISLKAGAIGPQENIMVQNAGGQNSSDYSSNDPNWFYASANEPGIVLKARLDSNPADDVALYFPATGRTDIHYRDSVAGFDGYRTRVIQNAVCKYKLCDDRVQDAQNPLYCPANNLKPGCGDGHKNMTYMFAGKFFRRASAVPQLDLLFVQATGSAVSTRFQRNDGATGFSQFSGELDPLPIPAIYEKVFASDFDGDGDADVFFYSDDGATLAYRNDDTTTSAGIEFAKMTNALPVAEVRGTTADPIVAVKTGDFNADGKTDLFFLWRSGKNSVYRGGSGMTFAAASPLTPATTSVNGVVSSDDVTVTELNGDGRADVILQLGTDTRRLLVSSPDGSYSLRTMRY